MRRLLRRTVRSVLRLLRRGPLARPLSRIAFHPSIARWCAGREVVRWRGVNVMVDPGEAHGFHVYFLGDYAAAEIETCAALCQAHDTFVDVGANIGLISLAVARARSDIRVLAVEPDPVMCDWLRSNIALNADLVDRIDVLQAAAADRDGPVRFAPSRSTLNIGTGHVTDAQAAASIDAEGRALGRLAQERAMRFDIVKIDVEGGEIEALRGLLAASTLPRGIVIETHAFTSADPDRFNRDLIHELTSRSYQIERLSRGRWHALTDPRDLGPRAHVRAVRSARTHHAATSPSDAANASAVRAETLRK